MPDILETIVAKRREDVAAAQAAVSEEALRARIAAKYPAAPLNLRAVACAAPQVVAAEFKRASPSKGDIAAAGVTVPSSVGSYIRGGAHILSVLTEPTWFKGSLDDLEAARGVADAAASSAAASRAVVLRKEFVFDAYQILEARAHGADTVLLIVSVVPEVEPLKRLIDFARSLGMEPLVEVNSVDEMGVALAAGSIVIGVNNRNLRTFTVDMSATTRVVVHTARLLATGALSRADNGYPVILSLSGIRSPEDVRALLAECGEAGTAAGCSVDDVLAVMRGFLIGEALMRAADPQAMVRELVEAATQDAARLAAGGGAASGTAVVVRERVAAKICGVKTVEGAVHAARSGADFVGVIMVPASPRHPGVDGAANIVSAIRAFREQSPAALLDAAAAVDTATAAVGGAAGSSAQRLADTVAGYARRHSALRAAAVRARPLTVGVFMDQPVDAVRAAADAAGLDVVQLHGSEDPTVYTPAALGNRPIIKVIHVSVTAADAATASASSAVDVTHTVELLAAWAPTAAALLLDSQVSGSGKSGGTGVVFDHEAVLSGVCQALEASVPARTTGALVLPLIVAGGLTADNVAAAVAACRAGCVGTASPAAWQVSLSCVDVSSGIEYTASGAAAAGLADTKGHKDPAKVAAFIAAAKE